MEKFYVEIGHEVSFSKTISESDVYQFAGITGDFSPNHTNKVYMEKSSYGRLMAHGALLVGFMSTASTMAIAHCRDAAETPISWVVGSLSATVDTPATPSKPEAPPPTHSNADVTKNKTPTVAPS